MAKDKMTKQKLLDFVERNIRVTRPQIIDELRRLRGVSTLSKTETRGYGCGWFRSSCKRSVLLKKNNGSLPKEYMPWGMGPGPLLYQAGKDPRYLKKVTVRTPAERCECCGKKIAPAKVTEYYEIKRKSK